MSCLGKNEIFFFLAGTSASPKYHRLVEIVFYLRLARLGVGKLLLNETIVYRIAG